MSMVRASAATLRRVTTLNFALMLLLICRAERSAAEPDSNGRVPSAHAMFGLYTRGVEKRAMSFLA